MYAVHTFDFYFFFPKWDKALLPACPITALTSAGDPRKKRAETPSCQNKSVMNFPAPFLFQIAKCVPGRKPQKRSQYDSIKDDFKRGRKGPLKFTGEGSSIGGWVCTAFPNSWEVFQSGRVRLIGCLHCSLWSSSMQITAWALQSCNPSKHFPRGGGRILSSRSVWAP